MWYGDGGEVVGCGGLVACRSRGLLLGEWCWGGDCAWRRGSEAVGMGGGDAGSGREGVEADEGGEVGSLRGGDRFGGSELGGRLGSDCVR